MPILGPDDTPYTLASPYSFWNRPLPRHVLIDIDSDAYVTSLTNQAYGHGHIAAFNFHEWTSGIYVTDDMTPRYDMTVDRPAGAIAQVFLDAFKDVPIPDDAVPSGPWPGDNHLAIYEPSTDTYWEMWKASKYEVHGPHSGGQATGTDPAVLNAAGWHLEFGGRCNNMAGSSGAFDTNTFQGAGFGWGARASKLMIAPGLITRSEGVDALNGVPNAIPHCLELALPVASKAPTFRWPAVATDGSGVEAFLPQEGMIFQLDPDYDLEPLRLAHPFMYAVNVALQNYGMVVCDTGGAVTIYCEGKGVVPGTISDRQEDVWLGPDDLVGPGHTGVFDDYPYGNDTNDLGMPQYIPWSNLRVIDSSYRPTQPVTARFIIGTP